MSLHLLTSCMFGGNMKLSTLFSGIKSVSFLRFAGAMKFSTATTPYFFLGLSSVSRSTFIEKEVILILILRSNWSTFQRYWSIPGLPWWLSLGEPLVYSWVFLPWLSGIAWSGLPCGNFTFFRTCSKMLKIRPVWKPNFNLLFLVFLKVLHILLNFTSSKVFSTEYPSNNIQ